MILSIPNKVIQLNIQSAVGKDYWPYNQGDEFWENGSSPRFYTWIISATVIPQFHSYENTREPYTYNGLDLNVGDWISNTDIPQAFEIISITEKTETSLVAIIRDTFRYNTFSAISQDGLISPQLGNNILFTLSVDGMPLLDPLPASINKYGFVSSLDSRFRKEKKNEILQLYKENNGFIKGDILSLDPAAGYILSDNNITHKILGTVYSSGPGPNDFIVSPVNVFSKNYQASVLGQIGDTLYISDTDPGKLTTENTGVPAYVKITNAIQGTSITTKSTDNMTIVVGNTFSLNNSNIVIPSTNIQDLVNRINTFTIDTGIESSLQLAPTSCVSNTADMAFGGIFVGITPPGSAKINNVEIIFNSDTASPGQWGEANDVAIAINNANIPGIVAIAENGQVTLTNTLGTEIVIENISNESFGSPIAGPNSATGLPLYTPAATNSFMKFVSLTGTGIIFKNILGNPIDELGLLSNENGMPAYVMSVANGIRTADTYVVANISARDALTPLTGDQAYVIDGMLPNGSKAGEWALYLWNGNSWIKTADEDSAKTDASSIELEIQYNSSEAVTIGKMSNNSKVTQISITVEEIFSNENATLSIGTDINNTDILMSSDFIDLTVEDTYFITPNVYFDSGTDTEIVAYLDSNGSTTGRVKIIVSYT